MKRIISLAAILVLAGAVFAWAGEEAEVYRQIYLGAEGLQQKYSAALNLIELQDRSVAPVLSEALGELLRTQNSYLEPSEKELYGRTVRMIAVALGDYKFEDAAPYLWSVSQQVSDPLAKAEAIMALGKMRATDYAERIALMLQNFDMGPGRDSSSDEKVAYGCIIALEKLKDPRGYMPVFYAMDAWYTVRVRQQAERSLPNIVADPTDSIETIIKNETTNRKIVALKQNAISQAPAARKIEAASQALSIGQLSLPRDRAEAGGLADLRKLAIRTFVGLRATGDDVVPLLSFSYANGFDDEERLLALQGLGANAGNAAAMALRDIILQLDRDQKSGISDETRNRMAKAAIENAGLTKNRTVRPALLAVISNDKWSGGILLAAQVAAKAIP
jgi:HEAT repeat protein